MDHASPDKDRYRRVKAIVVDAWTLPTEQREAYILAECAGDARLLDDVRNHLAAAEVSLLPAAAKVRPASSSPAATADDPGFIGPYRILRKLGEGGMGVVYHAEQTTPIAREVAIKLIKLGMDSAEVIGRFNAERAALAMLDHPCIAKIHDAGISEAGRPYFAMEYVAGERITDYCDKHKLSTNARLELFARLCDAVQHAHNKGIIHRDLKPSNVLVTLDHNIPTPKVIDFGIAKATASERSEREYFTRLGEMVGTPEYMSPEQAEATGLDIDTRSDIYSLGVILYELLVGALPFDPKTLRSVAYNEVQRIIREVDPPKPSTRLSNLGAEADDIAKRRATALVALRAELQRELEWIPLKALRKDRTQRYRSAMELADDVRNYLNGKALIAAPESITYQVRKFVGRNRTSVATAMICFGVGVVATAVSFAFILRDRNRAVAAEAVAREAERRADEERRSAQRERDRAEANFSLAADAVEDLFVRVTQDGTLASPSLRPLRAQLLSAASTFAERMAQEQPTNNAVRFEVARARTLLARIHADAGSMDAALADLESATSVYREALSAEGEPSVRHRRGLAGIESTHGSILRDVGQYEAAEKLLRSAVDTLEVTRHGLNSSSWPVQAAFCRLKACRIGRNSARNTHFRTDATSSRRRRRLHRRLKPRTIALAPVTRNRSLPKYLP